MKRPMELRPIVTENVMLVMSLYEEVKIFYMFISLSQHVGSEVYLKRKVNKTGLKAVVDLEFYYQIK